MTTHQTAAAHERGASRGPGETVPSTGDVGAVAGVEPGSSGATLPAVIGRDVDRVRQRNSLATLYLALDRLVDDADQLAATGDLYELADGLDQLRAFRKATADVERHVEDHVAQLMPQSQVNLDDEITLERHQGRTRKQWDWDGILSLLGAGRWIDPETGEYVIGTLKQVVSLTASVSPRVGALRDRGIQVDEYCESSPARTTVSVRTREDARG